MIYVMSDLHGCFDKYLEMMRTISLQEDDQLYILGDVVDRGPQGIRILQDLMRREQVTVLKGNHDDAAGKLLRIYALDGDGLAVERYLEWFRSWLSDGGRVTYEEFLRLDEMEKRRILDFLDRMPLYREVEAGGRRFFLAHSVPERKKMVWSGLLQEIDLLTGEPEYEKTYFRELTIVTGHTPTGLIDPAYRGRIWQKHNHIAIDCGAVFGNPLGCLCLDTGEEYYVGGM